jgi:Spy/CpxP family protein refolding chaperone
MRIATHAVGWSALVLLAAAVASAQGLEALAHTTPQQRAEVQTELMKAKLGLQPDQVAKIQAINLKYAQQMEPVIKGSMGPLIKARQAKSIDEQKAAELQTVLSPQQYQSYLASKEELRQKLEERLAAKREGGGD